MSAEHKAEHIIRAFVADLKTIKRPAYQTEVRTVEFPTHKPDDLDRCVAHEAPSLLCWVDKIAPISENSSEIRFDLRVLVIGVIKGREEIQLAVVSLSQDLTRCVYANPRRHWPGREDQQNTWGLFSKQAPGFNIEFRYHDVAGKGVASFLSMWDLQYRFPLSTG